MNFGDPFLRHAARARAMTVSERWAAFLDAESLWEKLVTAGDPRGWERAREASREAHREVWRRMMALRDAAG